MEVKIFARHFRFFYRYFFCSKRYLFQMELFIFVANHFFYESETPLFIIVLKVPVKIYTVLIR